MRVGGLLFRFIGEGFEDITVDLEFDDSGHNIGVDREGLKGKAAGAALDEVGRELIEHHTGFPVMVTEDAFKVFEHRGIITRDRCKVK